MWQRYNQTTHVFEKSADNGQTWEVMPIAASSIEGLTPLPPNIAFTNVHNVFTQNQELNLATPRLFLHDTTQPVNSRRFRIWASSQLFLLDAVDDAETTLTGRFSVNRSGQIGANKITLENGLIVSAGGASITGQLVVNSVHVNVGNLNVVGNTHTTGQIYPGRIDVSGEQASFYLASHASYGLYSNTGLYLGGSLYAVGYIRAGDSFYEKGRANHIGYWLSDFVPTVAGIEVAASGSGSLVYCFIGNTALVQFNFSFSPSSGGLAHVYMSVPFYNRSPMSQVGGSCSHFNGVGWNQNSENPIYMYMVPNENLIRFYKPYYNTNPNQQITGQAIVQIG